MRSAKAGYSDPHAMVSTNGVRTDLRKGQVSLAAGDAMRQESKTEREVRERTAADVEQAARIASISLLIPPALCPRCNSVGKC